MKNIKTYQTRLEFLADVHPEVHNLLESHRLLIRRLEVLEDRIEYLEELSDRESE